MTFPFYKSWDDYYERGIIPNVWKGITGQTSADRNTDETIAANKENTATELAAQKDMLNEQLRANKEQYEAELGFQENQLSQQMDFANRNLQSNENIANQNLALQQSAFDYQKELNATQMEREDSAIQRQIADYQAAGFSPLAAIGGNGASSAALSTGSAPQKDISGITSAQGQYADFARQYASLHYQASQSYMNYNNSARSGYARSHAEIAKQHNADITGARMALQQMKSDMHYKGMNLATQVFNSAVNYKQARLQNDYLEEQTNYLQDKHKWERVHGYRGETLANIIADSVNKLRESESIKSIARDLGISAAALKDFAEKFNDNHSKPIGQFLLDSDDLTVNEKNTLKSASEKTFNKPLQDLDTFELLQLADSVTREEDRFGYKVKNFLKGLFGFND